MHGLMIVAPVIALLSLSSCLQASTSPLTAIEAGPMPSNDNTERYFTHTESADDNNLLLRRKWESSMFEGRRTKRQTGRNSCRMLPQYVNFSEIGWNWIVAPQGYHSYTCGGECGYPLTVNLNGTNHAIVKSLLNLNNPSAVAKPCCVPTSYSPMTVITVEQGNNYVRKILQDMMVESCGCR